MRKSYERQTDVLATLVAQTPVQKQHRALTAMLAARTEYRNAAYAASYDYSATPARVLDAEGQEVAADFHAWIAAQIAEHGSAERVCELYATRGYLLTERTQTLHFLMNDRSPTTVIRQDDFDQIEVWEEQEFVERELFERRNTWKWPDELELKGGNRSALVDRFERRLIGAPRYRLRTVTDMAAFLAEGEAAWTDQRRRNGARRLVERNVRTGEERVIEERDLQPGYDAVRWPCRRFFDDWTDSSAGRSGARICTRWYFKVSDYTSAAYGRDIGFVPAWTHTRKIAALKDTHRLDEYALYGALNKLAERIGTPFVWFSYGLHGNLVLAGQMERVLEAAESGLIVLPEHDYRVLRRWADCTYGF